METFCSIRTGTGTLLLNLAIIMAPRETVSDRILLEGGSSNDAMKLDCTCAKIGMTKAHYEAMTRTFQEHFPLLVAFLKYGNLFLSRKEGDVIKLGP